MKWLAPAKINLSLRVLGRREDGFHEIETLMAPITLADELSLEPADTDADAFTGALPIELLCSDPTLPTDARNLAFRAAALFIGRVGGPGHPVRLTLQKRIPHGAGLGGGSSDAASVLLALDAYCGTRLDAAELVDIAAELGSDVPFFVYRAWRTSVGVGRGNCRACGTTRSRSLGASLSMIWSGRSLKNSSSLPRLKRGYWHNPRWLGRSCPAPARPSLPSCVHPAKRRRSLTGRGRSLGKCGPAPARRLPDASSIRTRTACHANAEG